MDKPVVVNNALVQAVLPHISLEQYFNALPRSRVTALVQEYNLETTQVSIAPGEKTEAELREAQKSDAVYERMVVRIDELKNLNRLFLRQLNNQLRGNGVRYMPDSKDLQEAVELAAIKCWENFGNLKKCAVVKVSKTQYLLASLDEDDITIRLLSPTQGTILVFRPRVFVPFTVGKKTA